MKVINKHIIFIVTLSIALGSFVFGYQLVAISMMADVIFENNAIPNDQRHFQLSIITTLLPIGAFLGSFLTESLANRIGERKSMLLLDLLAFFMISYHANHINLASLYASRFLLGIYFGLLGSIIPTYLVSMSPPQMTGLVGSFNQLLITIGIAVAYKMGMTANVGWIQFMQFPAYFCLLRVFSLLLFKFDTLERHHKQNQHQILHRYVTLFYQNGSIEELRKIRNLTIETSNNEVKIKVQTSQKKYEKIIQRFTSGIPTQVAKLAIVIALANQFSGINAIIYYAKQIFQQISDSKTALQYTYYIGLLQVAVTFVSGFLINNYGRRNLMLIGYSVVIFSLISAYLCEVFLADSQKYIAGLIFLHLIGFSLSLGSVTMIYIAQLMENISFINIICWILTILASLSSDMMISTLGIGKSFLFYGVVSLFCLIYMIRHMVESKGLTRQQLVSLVQNNQFQNDVEQEKVQLEEVDEEEKEK